MSALGHRIRLTIVDALQDADAIQPISPALLAAFEKGLADVPLSELSLDSLTRMELLVALEMEYETVLSPSVFAESQSLGDIIACVERSAAELEAAPATNERVPDHPPFDARCRSESGAATESDPPLPRIARLFRRGFRRCRTVAEMNRLLGQLADRMTPLEAAALRVSQQRGRLLPEGAAPKFGAALSEWSDGFERGMRRCGKADPEPFTSRRISPAAMYYIGPGDRADKTLVICFSAMGYRNLSIAQAMFLQHIDASEHDVLIISDIANTAFRSGVPLMGANVHEVVGWVANLKFLGEYAGLRAIGCSAGVYPATLTGRRIGAEVTVGLNGRFPSERYFGTLVRMYVNSWISSLRHRKARVLLVHSVTMRRDVAFARRLCWLTGASRFAIEMPDRNLEHNVLPPLLQHSELMFFLDRTLFAPADSELFAGKRTVTTIRFPLD